MTKLRYVLAAGIAVAAAPAGAQELRIGFLNTMTGGGAAVGVHQVNGWKLGLEHEGWTKDGDKIGGVAARIFYGDDQFKPDVGLAEVEKMLKVHKVQLMAGFIWSNVLLASLKPMMEAKVGLIITNAGASPVAGAQCNPLIVSMSWNSDQSSEALGKLVSEQKIGKIILMAPNYQAGKDVVSGLKRTMKGPQIVDEIFFKVGETDFQADISKVRAAKPDALFIFAPGAMAPAFFKQWGASGAGMDIKLFSSNTVDHLTLPALGDAAVGSFHALQWNVDLPNAANQKFVKDYVAKFGHMPSNYAHQAYDAPRLLAATLKATGGKFEDMGAFMKRMRKTPYESTRGAYSYNVNGLPIQTFYRLDVVKGGDGKPAIVTRGPIVQNVKDSYWETCPANMRY